MIPLYGIKDSGICACREGKSCRSPGKHPISGNWQKQGSLNKEEILSWFVGNKVRNLGVLTGKRNSKNGKYLLVLDIDAVDHPLFSVYSTKTLWQRTGRGGSHLFFWCDTLVSNSASLLGENLDIRGKNGLVVAAPSKHISGNSYVLSENLEIIDFPTELREKLEVSYLERGKNKKKEKSKTDSLVSSSKVRVDNQTWQFWNKIEPSAAIEAMNLGYTVPVGVRNVVMHRLLSSFRGRGLLRDQLEEKARELCKFFDKPEEFLEEALQMIDKSILRYPAYNNNHEKVNSVYISWLRKNNFKSQITLEELEKLDGAFFGGLRKCKDGETGLSLDEISKIRSEFFISSGIKKFSNYKLQLLAKKLESLGFKKKRTASCNIWLVSFERQILDKSLLAMQSVLRSQVKSEKKNKEKMSKKTKNTPSEEKTGQVDISTLKDGDVFLSKDGNSYKVVDKDVPVSMKEHPREHLYKGRTGLDWNKGFALLCEKLTEEQSEKFVKNSLIVDREKTMEFARSLRVGDVIGVKNMTFTITSLNLDEDETSLEGLSEEEQAEQTTFIRAFVGKDIGFKPVTLKKDKEYGITIFDIDIARECGCLDLLWRDKQPFGYEDKSKSSIKLRTFTKVETNQTSVVQNTTYEPSP